MKEYIKPEVDEVRFNIADVITFSDLEIGGEGTGTSGPEDATVWED